ncbi:MAG: hypothetical protein EXQ70_08755 [Solirubrobacterales bacterium]|nr:hypothetical protein [Solirubrobacterales bacterium]
MRRLAMLVGMTIFLVGACVGSAAAKDTAGVAFNILPSGQFGVPGPPAADDQALMYDGLGLDPSNVVTSGRVIS